MPTMPTIDYSWENRVNPNNTPWVPGFRFFVRQRSVRSTSRMVRRYHVQFHINEAGALEWCGGVKPTDETWEHVRARYGLGLKDQQPRPKDP